MNPLSPVASLFLAVLWLAAPAVSSAQGDAAQLHTRALRLLPSFFQGPDAGKHLIQLPKTPSGEDRFNAMPFLRDLGFIEPPRGTEATWLPSKAVLVLTTNLEGHRLVERFFEIHDGVELPILQLTISLWEYRDDGRESRPQPYTVEALKKIDADASMLHTQTIQTRSGNSVMGVSGYAGAAEVQKAPPSGAEAGEERKADLRGTRGSAFYFEPVANPHYRSVDRHYEYEVRVPASKPGMDVDFRGNGTLATFYGKDIIVQIVQPPGKAPEGEPETKRTKYALAIRADIREEPKVFAGEADAQIKARVLEELLWEKNVLQNAGSDER